MPNPLPRADPRSPETAFKILEIPVKRAEHIILSAYSDNEENLITVSPWPLPTTVARTAP
jgi:hypothetical protein